MTYYDRPKDQLVTGYETGKRAPSKKNTKQWCRGKVGVPHETEIQKDKYYVSLNYKCKWTQWNVWRRGERVPSEPKFHCHHVEACKNCGKILRHFIAKEECPEFTPKTS